MSRVLLVLVSLSFLVSAAQAQTVSYFPVKADAWGIAAGADGNLWFTVSKSSVDRITPLGEVTIFARPWIPSTGGAIAVGPNRTIWFTRTGGVDSIDVDTEVASAHSTLVEPTSLTAGPDGNIWFGYTGGIGRMEPSGATTLFSLEDIGGRAPQILDITAGADGNLWFTEYPFNQVGRITPLGAITYFATYPATCCGPIGIASGFEGALWMAFSGGNRIARLGVDGTVTGVFEAPAGPSGPPDGLHAVAPGPDGRMWYAGQAPVVAAVSPSGEISIVKTPLAARGTREIAAGPDGNVWATIEPPSYSCVIPCTSEPTTPLTILRVNLVNPAPRITGSARSGERVVLRGLGFVPDSVIRWNGVDRPTIYVSPYEIALVDVGAAVNGGTFAVRNNGPGGGDSAPLVLEALSSPRRRDAR